MHRFLASCFVFVIAALSVNPATALADSKTDKRLQT